MRQARSCTSAELPTLALRTLLSGFRVPNHIRSAVLGSLFLRYPCLAVAQTHNEEDAEGIRAMILSDDDGTEFDSKVCGTVRWRGVYRRVCIG
jgi:hypothetical protein